eukprot:tig00000842_g4828.t1
MGPKLDPKDFIFSKQKGQTLIKKPGSIDGQQFIIEDLEDCEVYLLDWSAQVSVDCCKNCRFFIGPVEGSIFFRNCDDCVITVACAQFRTRECNRCDVFLFAGTEPVVEASSSMRFAPWNGAYPCASAHFAAAKLNPADNRYAAVFDFNKDDDSIPMPHWALMPADEFKPAEVPLDGEFGPVENPVSEAPASGAPAATSADGGMMSFDLSMSQAEAEAILAERDEAPSVFNAPAAANPAAPIPLSSPSFSNSVPMPPVHTGPTDKDRAEEAEKAQRRNKGEEELRNARASWEDKAGKLRESHKKADPGRFASYSFVPLPNKWESICALIDSVGASGKAKEGEKSKEVEGKRDASRLRSLLLSLKHNPARI